MKSCLIRGGRLVTMNAGREVKTADLRIQDGRIHAIAENLKVQGDEDVVDARGTWVIPGLIQAHTHLCQTLFRGLADDLELLDWLEQKIWPFENAHNAESLRSSAEIGLLEMQLAGTTTILDMGTTRLHEVVFEVAEKSGIRYWGGNCLMDRKATSGPLYREFEDTLQYSEKLIHDWHRKTPRLNYAISPRFAISCSEKILKTAVRLQRQHDILLHTHASENRHEVELIKKRTGLTNVHYLKKLGLLNRHTVIAHGIHLSALEVNEMVGARAGLTHCPSSNLKLASGIAPITRYLKKGMNVALGADGAPCNNTLDPFMEMRLAALLQKPLFGPTALKADEAFALATLGGARVLNAEDQIGSLEVGKRADVVIVRRDHPSHATVADPYSALVYSCSGRDVRDVWIEGERIVANAIHQRFSRDDVLSDAARELARLLDRLKV